MPKRVVVMLTAITLLLLAGVFGCGSGDTGTIAPLNPLDLLTGGTGTGTGPGGTGGGGGTGACAVPSNTAGSVCTNALNAGQCQSAGGTLYSGATCQSLGYSCQIIMGYEVCSK